MNLRNMSTEDLYFLRNKYFEETKKISKQTGNLTLDEAETISFYNEICEELLKRGEIE